MARPLPFGVLAGERRQFVGEQLDQRRFAGAVATEQRDALAGAQRQFDAVENHLGRRSCVVSGLRFVQHQQRVRRCGRVAEAEGEGRVDVRRRHLLHALQCLHAALRLPRLGGLGAEAVDEAVQVLDLALLLLEHCLLQRELRRAGARKRNSCRNRASCRPARCAGCCRRPHRGSHGRARSSAACRGSRAASLRARARRRGRGGWSARRAAAGRSGTSGRGRG